MPAASVPGSFIPIEGGALWTRQDLGLLMVVDPETFLPDQAIPPQPVSHPAPLSSQSTEPRGEIIWQGDIGLFETSIRIRCRVNDIRNTLRRRLSHMVQPSKGPPEHELDLCGEDGLYQVWCNGVLEHVSADIRDLTGFAYTDLLSLAVAPRRIALSIHAAALIVDDMPLLLSASSGGGKTTLSIALAADKATLVTDDTVALLQGDFTLAGLPVALRVRPSGWPIVAPYLPERAATLETTRRGLRHIPPTMLRSIQKTTGPARAVILLDFQAGVPTEWRRLTETEGLSGVIAGGATLPHPLHPATAQWMAHWCSQTPFFQLTYGTLPGGLEGVYAIRSSLA